MRDAAWKLRNLHPRLLPIELGGAMKELFGWGLRCGSAMFGLGTSANAQAALDVLDAKRAQVFGAHPQRPDDLAVARREGARLQRDRGRAQAEARDLARTRGIGLQGRERGALRLELGGPSLRQRVLHADRGEGRPGEQIARARDPHRTGLSCSSPTDLRVAFSCLEAAQVVPLFETIHTAIQELRAM